MVAQIFVRTWQWVAISLLVVVCSLAVLVFYGIVWPNRILAARYDVEGVDVSHYQGEIDWDVLAAQDLDFAWIKATEGASHTDSRFAETGRAATKTDLLVGAYHFMSFESPGADQAAHLAAQVPATPGTLPPVIDLEFYGAYRRPPGAGRGPTILDRLVAGIEEHYGVPPIVYATEDAYDLYLADRYPGLPIWIRSVAAPPACRTAVTGRSGSTPIATVPGHDGVEPYIDMNVFAATREELESMTLR